MPSNQDNRYNKLKEILKTRIKEKRLQDEVFRSLSGVSSLPIGSYLAPERNKATLVFEEPDSSTISLRFYLYYNGSEIFSWYINISRRRLTVYKSNPDTTGVSSTEHQLTDTEDERELLNETANIVIEILRSDLKDISSNAYVVPISTYTPTDICDIKLFTGGKAQRLHMANRELQFLMQDIFIGLEETGIYVEPISNRIYNASEQFTVFVNRIMPFTNRTDLGLHQVAHSYEFIIGNNQTFFKLEVAKATYGTEEGAEVIVKMTDYTGLFPNRPYVEDSFFDRHRDSIFSELDTISVPLGYFPPRADELRPTDSTEVCNDFLTSNLQSLPVKDYIIRVLTEIKYSLFNCKYLVDNAYENVFSYKDQWLRLCMESEGINLSHIDLNQPGVQDWKEQKYQDLVSYYQTKYFARQEKFNNRINELF